MRTSTGNFFDGVSSRPRPVELRLDERGDAVIVSVSETETITWPLAEVSVAPAGKNFEIRHGKNSIQAVDVSDADFIAELKRLRREKGHTGWYQLLLEGGFKLHLGIAAFILAMIAVGYLFVLPWVAEKAVYLMPESFDDRLGDLAYEGFVEEESIDSLKTATLQEFAGHLKLHNNRPLKFEVVDENIVNAFALPNGNIVVYTGLIEKMEGPDELVGLIGHEASHVNKRHSMKMMTRNLAGYLFISVVLSDVNGIMAIIADNAQRLHSLSYSRNFEREADEGGLEILRDNKIDPKGMTLLFERLKSESGDMVPEMLSTHPVTDDRIAFVEEAIGDEPGEIDPDPRLEELFLILKNN